MAEWIHQSELQCDEILRDLITGNHDLLTRWKAEDRSIIAHANLNRGGVACWSYDLPNNPLFSPV